MVHYFWGEDTYGARQAIDALARGKKARLSFLDRADIEAGSFLSRLEAGGGLFEPIVFVVRDPSQLPASLQKELALLKKKTIKAECILWDRETPDKRASISKAFSSIATKFPALQESALQEWIQQESARHGSNFTAEGMRLFMNRDHVDRWQMASEIMMLSLAYPRIDVKEVKSHIVFYSEGEDVFRLVDAIMQRQEQRAMVLVQKSLSQGESELRLLSLLAYQLRTLLLIQKGHAQGLSAENIAKRFKIHPYAVKKNMALAAKYGASRLLDMYTRIMATDFAMKQGTVDMRTGLVMLIRSFVATP